MKLPSSSTIKSTTEVYDRIARDYAEVRFDDPIMESSLQHLIELIGEQKDVLDVGCGPGRDVAAMMRKGFDVVGIDSSLDTIAVARERVPSGIFRAMDVRDLKYPSESFSAVWACAVMVHLPNEAAAAAIKECARVMRKGGILGITVEEGDDNLVDHLGRYRNLYRADQFDNMLEQSGSKTLDLRIMQNDKATIGASKPRQ